MIAASRPLGSLGLCQEFYPVPVSSLLIVRTTSRIAESGSASLLKLDDGMKGYLPGIVGGIGYGSKRAAGPDP
jgi:hypothetical protein